MNRIVYRKIFYSLIFIVLVSCSACEKSNELVLIENGKSDYHIVVAGQADTVVSKAALELQKYVLLSTGVQLPILDDLSDPSDYEIVVGVNARSMEMTNELSLLDEDGFWIHTKGSKLYILGGKEMGVLYGVYTFLEESLGCRKYSHEVELVPELETIRIPSMDLKQVPAFRFRELHMPMARWSRSYRDWHKLDYKEGKNEWGMFVHTFDDFIPAEKFYKTHPEYFSYLNVKRIPDGQLCLSNPDVFKIVVDSLKSRMALKPEALYWSVSQNDTYKPCACEECLAEYDAYGGYSGAMIHFVNQVAEVFPDKVISTLAYQYTRSAPTNIRPRENVNIMFCSIECNRSRPLSTDSLSASFRKDTEDWCRLTNNIFMWDYVVQFRNLVSPFPNLRVLQPNLQYFRDAGMQMMFQQGSGGLISEFVELRSYLIAKLLWNPDADVEALTKDFCQGYYGPAGEHILEYINTMHDALDASGGDLGIYGYPYDGIHSYLTPELMKRYTGILDRAEQSVAGHPEYLQRVQTARLPMEFAILDVSLRNVNAELSFFSRSEGKWEIREEMLERLDRFTDRAIDAGIARYWEHGNYPEDYRNTVARYVTTSMQDHLALNKPVTLFTEASPKYPVGGASALTDGLKGINDYHFNWLGFEGPDMELVIDLGAVQDISRIELDFLQEIKSWVFLPREVAVQLSEDGNQYHALQVRAPEAPLGQQGTFIETFAFEFASRQARYVKIDARNLGICPDWHPGATYPAWVFCDEVMVW